MPKRVVNIDIVVVVFPVLRSRIVRRIDIDHVYLARVRVRERGQGVVVVTLYQDMRRSGRVVRDSARLVSHEHRQRALALFHHIFGLILPHEAIALGLLHGSQLIFELSDTARVFYMLARPYVIGERPDIFKCLVAKLIPCLGAFGHERI